MEKYIYRFVTPQAILTAKQEEEILRKREQGFKGPLGAVRLDVESTIEAFLDYFDKLGEDSWIYCGMAEWPDLPYGGVHVFRKIANQNANIFLTKTKKETPKKIEDRELTNEESIKMEEQNARDSVVLDISKERKASKELLNAPSAIVNEALFKQEKVVDRDPDEDSDVVDELEAAQEMGDEMKASKEVSKSDVRFELYKTYEEQNKGKKAIVKGKETAGFRSWIDVQKAEFDPEYNQYKLEKGVLAIKDEQETLEFKEWLKQKMKKDESGH